MNCNATLTTATETDEVVAHLDVENNNWMWHANLDTAVIRRGDRLMRLDLHTLTCDGESCAFLHEYDGADTFFQWTDDTPGATPHAPAVEVSDAEVVAAARILILRRPWDRCDTDDIRAALLAAKQAAQETDR